jgi:hypothetical protein
MSKVFEKILNQNLIEVKDNGFVDDNQFGFCQDHSTEDALLNSADMDQKE